VRGLHSCIEWLVCVCVLQPLQRSSRPSKRCLLQVLRARVFCKSCEPNKTLLLQGRMPPCPWGDGFYTTGMLTYCCCERTVLAVCAASLGSYRKKIDSEEMLRLQ
jgi:transposase